MDYDVSVLNKLGLTHGEVNVYLALAELGNTTVGPIIDKSGVSSSKVYIILEKLIQKGLATFIIKEKTRYFQANPPESLKDFLISKEEELRSQEKQLDQFINRLKGKISNTKKKEEARIFKGFDGVKAGFFEAINSIPQGGEYLFLSAGYGSIEELKTLFHQIFLKLKERKLKLKGLADISEKKTYRQVYLKLGYKMKFVELFWPSDTSIIGDYLCILVYHGDKPVLYSIKSETLVSSYTQFFNKMWDKSK